MALIVFDMGQRITTPIKGGHQRVSKTSKTSATHAIDSTDPHFIEAAHAYSEQQHTQQHVPKAVAYLGEIMTSPVMTLSADEYVDTAWQIFKKSSFNHMPIINDKKNVIAILSKSDILLPPDQQQDILDQPAMKFANKQVFCFTFDSDIRQATKIMSDYNLGALPIINHKNELQGIVSRSDILKVLSHYGPLELWA